MTDLRLEIEPGILPSDRDINHYFNQQIEQLNLKVNAANRGDYEEIFGLLNIYLSYPDSELSERHRQSNKLGELDLKNKKQKQANIRQSKIRAQNQICNCCGFFVQQSELSVCSQKLIEINHIGSSTIVFFHTFANIGILLAVMTLVYSVFSFSTNLTISSSNNYANSQNSTIDYLSISLGSKINNSNKDSQTFYLVSSWLGVAFLTIWLVLFICMKKRNKSLQNEAKSYMSVSDFSIVIQKMPIGLQKQEVQAMMDEYIRRVAPPDIEFKQFKIQKYNEAKPFYFNEQQFKDDELEQIHKRIKQIKEELVEWIQQRVQESQFSSTKQYREMRIKELNQVRQKISAKNEQIVSKINQKFQQKQKHTKTFVFITFQTVQQRDFFLSLNSNQIFTKIKNSLPCFDKTQRFVVKKDGKQFENLVIEAAPQPQDINWGNIGFGECESILRMMATFLATLLMLGISFVIVYGLSTVQNKNSKQRFVSIIISLVISLINILIIKVIQNMTEFQKIYTSNNYQISLAYKSILAQLLNLIFVPVIVNVYIKNNLYGASGLTEDIFILAITNSFVAPLVRLIDPYYIFLSIKYWYYNNHPFNKILLSQFQLNYFAEKPEYELGLEYIYLVSNFLFICFFVSLQPVIPLFGLLGLFFMYWIQKNAVFHKSQRPVPGVDTISGAMYQLLYLGGVAYALGSLTWSIFLKQQNFHNSLIPNLIAAGIGTLIFIFPYESCVSYKQNSNCKKSYSDRRIYFPAQYDRLNPVTKKEGVRQYRQFLQKKKEQIQSLPQNSQNIIAQKFLNLTQNNTYKGKMIKNNFFGNNEAYNVINQLFQNQYRNFIDPKLLRSYLVPRDHDRNIDIYASALQLRNANPFSQNQINIGKSIIRTNSNYHQNDLRLTENYTYFDMNPDNELKNLYKSSLKLGKQLGVISYLKSQQNHRRKS